MRNLEIFLTNPFDDPGISLDELLNFATDFLSRANANNPGGFLTARIAAALAALTPLQAASGSDQIQLGLRKAAKDAKNTFRKSLPEEIGKVALAVAANYGEDSAQVTECFPAGRTVFTRAADDRLNDHFTAMIAGVAAHVADLGAPLLAQATALQTNWLTIYAASEASGGAKSLTEAARREARGVLQLELFRTLLTIGLQYPRQPEKLAEFMTQSLLKDHPHHPDAPTPPPGP